MSPDHSKFDNDERADARRFNYDERATTRAWETFVTDGAEPRSSVRSLIQESWSRSANLGIDANSSHAPIADLEDKADHSSRAIRELRHAVQKSFAQIGQLLTGTRAMLILTDCEGTIIEAIGDKQTLDEGRKVHLEVGGTWNESVIGTNGIGVALRTRVPVFVHAAEHFCVGVKSWTCAAAPILDPIDHSVIGVIDLSGPPEIFQDHNTALVAVAAREVQVALAETQRENRARLLEAFLDATPTSTSDDAVVILDRYGRVVYQRTSPDRAIFEDASKSIAIGQQLVALEDTMTDADIVAALPDGLMPRDTVLLSLSGELCGAGLVLPSRLRSGAKSHGIEATLKSAPPPLRQTAGIFGQSEELLNAINLATKVSQSDASVLIEGETGVGKELFARLIHGQSKKSLGPFIAMNCGAISKELFGGELFGHVAGAFTGATRDGKAGKFELSHNGVLCLDEIGEMPMDLQPFLLRVLEQRAIYRIGDNKRRPVDVRLIALTNRNLKQEIQAGHFRNDLYYRISTVVIRIPPLRDREGDVQVLTEHFNQEIAAKSDKSELRFSDEIIEFLTAYHWPGNVRELKNLIERLHLIAQEVDVQLSDLPTEIREAKSANKHDRLSSVSSEDTSQRGASIEEAERQAITNAITSEGGNMTRVAAVLGVSRPTLYRKMKLYGIRRFYE